MANLFLEGLPTGNCQKKQSVNKKQNLGSVRGLNETPALGYTRMFSVSAGRFVLETSPFSCFFNRQDESLIWVVRGSAAKKLLDVKKMSTPRGNKAAWSCHCSQKSVWIPAGANRVVDFVPGPLRILPSLLLNPLSWMIKVAADSGCSLSPILKSSRSDI